MALRLRLWQARLLRACVSDSTGESARALLQRAPRDVLATLPLVASFHRVVGHVNKALGGVVPAAVRASLARLQMDEVARKVLARENLRRSDHLLRELEIPFLVVKGPILSAVIYDDPRVRFYRDLDLIVPAARSKRSSGLGHTSSIPTGHTSSSTSPVKSTFRRTSTCTGICCSSSGCVR